MLNGLSEKLLVSHYENNYGGALRRLNAIEARIRSLDWATAPVFEINGIKREELIAAGSVILHETYFDALGGGGGDPPAGLGLAEALERDFGSVAAWTSEFTAIAKAQAGGSGWTTLVWSDRLGRLINQWAADHAHALAGGAPILALDMYEHAYHLDFGARAAAYVDAVMGNLHWERIAARYRQARHGEAGGRRPVHAVRLAIAEPSHVDLSRGAARGSGPRPAGIAGRLHRSSICRAAATCCRAPPCTTRRPSITGRRRCRAINRSLSIASSVSRSAATRWRNCAAAAYDARALKGGIGAWHAIGGPTIPLDQTTYES